MTMHAPVSEPTMAVEDVSFALRGVTILDRVSLTLLPGSSTTLIGPNGCGKTTLLRLLMGLIRPSHGRVAWGGRGGMTPPRCAIVFQRPVMLRRSTAGNVRYALAAAGIPRAERANRCAELLALVGLSELGSRPARRLSGGEQQRLALARALAKKPRVLFLDEPTASLDPAATKSVEDVIHSVTATGIKVVMSTHDLGQAKRIGGEVVLMHRGRIVEGTDAASFFSRPKTPEAARFIAGELLV
jgi:tungstate transport system ATP-binding protein